MPFISIQGEPLLLLNIIERKFILFGVIFWPQDFFILVIAMILMIIMVVLFTIAFGRLFCGWVCPQTIFLEHVFRRIEYWIEGNAQEQMARRKRPWDAEKILRKGSKHLIFYLIAFLISNTFLAYIIGIHRLQLLVIEGPAEHLSVLIPLLLFSGIFYWVFAWFREQVCIVVCPYGRLQGVMLDKDSVVVAYDYQRGEPRGKLHRNEKREIGDCVDCHQCIAVCPTGIDIRNGTQLECTHCTACIDACNHIMDKVGLPQNLIRYASENGISQQKKLRFTNRMIGYSAVLVVLSGLLFYLLWSRAPIEATLLRTPGMRYQERDDHRISNLYNIKVINKTHRAMSLSLRPSDFKGEIQLVGLKQLIVPPEGIAQGVCFIIIDPKELHHIKTKLSIGVFDGEKELDAIETTFLGNEARK